MFFLVELDLFLFNIPFIASEIMHLTSKDYLAIYVQEAKQALELMGKWEMIDLSDALELLSPVFESEEVGTVLLCVYI